MTIKGATAILEKHNRWRRGEDIEMIDPALLGTAIDIILDKLQP